MSSDFTIASAVLRARSSISHNTNGKGFDQLNPVILARSSVRLPAAPDASLAASPTYRADLYKAAGQKASALGYYQRAARINPLDVRPLNETGIPLCESGRKTKGMEFLQRVLSIEPNQVEAHVNLATAYFNSGNSMLAELHFKEALRINPSIQEAREGIRILQRRRRT